MPAAAAATDRITFVMHRIGRLLAIVIAASIVAVPALAENGDGDYRIGVVNIKDVFDAYEKQIDEYEKLRKKRDELQQPIDALSEQITKDKERYDEQKDKMSGDERHALEEKIEAAVAEYRTEFKRAQEDIDQQEKRLIRDLFEDIYLAIQEVGAKFNYHLVFESGDDAPSAAGRPGGLLYHSTTLNMTQRVIEHLNTKYKSE